MIHAGVLIRLILSFFAFLSLVNAQIGIKPNEKKQADSFQLQVDVGNPEVPDSSFVVFDGTRFREKPDMSRFGFEPIEVVYAMRMWKKKWNRVEKSLSNLPSRELVSRWARLSKRRGAEYVVIDIEHWPNHGKAEVVQQSISNYQQVLKWFKESNPSLKYGLWSTVPIKKRYMKEPPIPKYYNRWKENNDKLTPLADEVDAFFPQLYTYSKDRQQWVTNARYMIQEARRYNGDKPVYVFLWPQYYGIDHKNLKDVYIEEDFWQLQLKVARKYADGIVIWFPYKARWENASQKPWWELTKEFIRELE